MADRQSATIDPIFHVQSGIPTEISFVIRYQGHEKREQSKTIDLFFPYPLAGFLNIRTCTRYHSTKRAASIAKDHQNRNSKKISHISTNTPLNTPENWDCCTRFDKVDSLAILFTKYACIPPRIVFPSLFASALPYIPAKWLVFRQIMS